MDRAGLIYDDSRHYIDHLAPFCSLAKWPLIICEPELAEITSHFYPDLEVVYTPIQELLLPRTIVSCDNTPLLSASFPYQSFHHLWLPHGNSDKGWNSFFFEALKEEKIALVYGQKMVDFISAKNVFPKMIRIGNFRWEYFKRHESFYQKTIKLPKGKNFLYAPTWDDSENNCSFWDAFPLLANHLPKDCNLLIKLHPNTTSKFGPELEILKGRYAKKENLIFWPEYPPIYPLLSQCDAYIGDMSSIGYDFLKFGKPMYFLNAKPHLPLHKCGIHIDPKTFDFHQNEPASFLKKELYEYTFDPPPNWNEIHALSCL
jgi:hypothetical protein